MSCSPAALISVSTEQNKFKIQSTIFTNCRKRQPLIDIAEFFKSDDLEQEVNLPLMQKIKMIDMALSNKRMKDNLQTLITQ